MGEPLGKGMKQRVLQEIARAAPGAKTLRVRLHRLRGVHIGEDVWIGYDVVLETSKPELITIGDRAAIGIRTTVIGHFRELQGVTIEEDAFIGPGVIVMPNVVIGRGAVVTAGSVVTRSIPPMTVAQGNPAVPIARVGVILAPDVTMKTFSRALKRLGSRADSSCDD